MFIIILWTICSFSSVLSMFNQEAVKPTVMWHGLDDDCCNPDSLGGLKALIEQEIPGVYVLSLMIGKNVVEDRDNSYYMNVNDQVNIVCEQLASDPKLALGYNAVGFSQGAQFLRAVAQRCPTPRMHNLISIGGQHQGVYGIPNSLCRACNYFKKLLNIGAYSEWAQNNFVPAQYWHDPMNEKRYRKKSSFIAEINNERYQNDVYKQNLLQLENFVMVKFDYDQLVKPVATSWFGFYTPGQAVEITSLEKSQLYKKDRLGLRELDRSGRLHFISVPDDHLQFSDDWFTETIINKYLRNTPSFMPTI